MSTPYLSIVIPAYNEATRLPQTLTKVIRFVEAQPYQAEILVVENGSQDGTYEIARGFSEGHPSLRVLHEEGRGKGLAVRRGMLAARGQYRFMADADLSMPIEEVSLFLPPLTQGYDIAIGSREAAGAVRYNEPQVRHLGGRGINSIIRWFALPGLNDTQCGFKCFSAAAAEDLFGVQTLTGWSFDIELLYVARLRGYHIIEIPIQWYYTPESKVKPLQDALRMIADIFRIRRNARQGLYERSVRSNASTA